MLKLAALLVLASAVLTAFGWAVLSPLRGDLRRALLPSAPLIGVTFLVCGLHTTGLLLPVRAGIWVMVGAAVALVVWAVVRRSVRPWGDSASLAWCAVALVVGAPMAWVAMAPNVELNSTSVVSASPSNDAVYYVSVSSWLMEHPIVDPPSVESIAPGGAPTGAPPGDGPAQTALDLPLRVGQELVQGALDTLAWATPESTFGAWIAAWVLLVPGGCIAASTVLGVGRCAGAVAGVVLASSTVLVQQAYNQNAASVLGIALVPLMLALFVAALGSRAGRGTICLAALLLAGVVGTYSEFAPFVAPAVVAFVLLRRRGLLRAARRAVLVVAVAVVLAPLAWYRAAVSLLGNGSGADDPSISPYIGPDWATVGRRLVGFGTAVSGVGVTVAWMLVTIVVVGALAALVAGPARAAWAGWLASSAAVIYVLSTGSLDYAQRRAVEITYTVGLFFVVVGWWSLAGVVRRRWKQARPSSSKVGRVATALTAATVLLSTVTWVSLNTRSSLASFDPASLSARHVDDTFVEAGQWVRDLGGEEGEDVSALVPEFFDQQWLTVTLAGEDAVEYPALRPDYLRVSSYWSGGTDRYWLVGQGVQVSADPGVVVRQNDRFRMLDLDRGEAVIAAPYDLLNWNLFVRPGGGFATVGDATALVVRTPGVPQQIGLTVRGESTAPLDVVVSAPREPSTSVAGVTSDAEQLVVDLPAGSSPVLVSIEVDSPTDPAAARWVVLSGVSRAN